MVYDTNAWFATISICVRSALKRVALVRVIRLITQCNVLLPEAISVLGSVVFWLRLDHNLIEFAV